MKITFPHMGSTHIGIKCLFDELGVETVIPPKISKKTLEIGTKYAPELICLPLKITLGNYIESIERGADTIVVTGSCGPCRYGYYSEVQKEILKDLGHDVEMVVLEAPHGNIPEFLKRVHKISNTKNPLKIAKSLKNAAKVLKRLNEIEAQMLQLRPHEMNKGDFDQVYKQLIKNLENSCGAKEMLINIEGAFKHIIGIPLKRKEDALKVGIVGEIYTVIEDAANVDIGKKLNDMGVEVYKSHSASEWLTENIFYRSIGLTSEQKIEEASDPYMKTLIGGHAKETIGHTVLYSERGFDGVIQVLPFTCMPEIVSMSILPRVQQDHNIPVLSLIIDELTGEAGYLTRVEAYIDLLRNRRESKKDEKMLSRH
ncbi:Predicted nucleotide-binding protein, sugar kinase/HSP70/actin superfamily [Geosporobacter subterraneus DSM 17957]|uniref:Predicted nucleotide-binding protein, sugar kinase/HSP70/actin superfamily n=1 Tax=Geosporobacter subterraneus DSM 17957 TaxID=1121919 RepID=A0A1M6LN45_9FIRM|nr:CoA protein activase [Geosporobacter subterraneus]SHJ72614.1 Predicted nucleotide-binding protein, sugar kinase/HSP70/actin superfamily [Geosporobacter subterraneus DSM 17957]